MTETVFTGRIMFGGARSVYAETLEDGVRVALKPLVQRRDLLGVLGRLSWGNGSGGGSRLLALSLLCWLTDDDEALDACDDFLAQVIRELDGDFDMRGEAIDDFLSEWRLTQHAEAEAIHAWLDKQIRP